MSFIAISVRVELNVKSLPAIRVGFMADIPWPRQYADMPAWGPVSMKFSAGALTVLLSLLAIHEALGQTHIVPSAFVAMCNSDRDGERAKCAALLRGDAERLGLHFEKSRTACREAAFRPGDVAAFVKFSSSHMIPDSGEAFALAANFWLSDLGNIPCDGGYWSTGYLLSLCSADSSVSGVCNLYLGGVLGIAQVEAVIGKTRYFCPKGNPIRSYAEVLAAFRTWAAGDPSRADEPAARGYIDALAAAYPC